jgi:hypothetical protein
VQLEVEVLEVIGHPFPVSYLVEVVPPKIQFLTQVAHTQSQ